MKNLLILLCLLLPVFCNAQIGFKVEAGPVFSDYKSDLKNPESDWNKGLLSFQIQGLVNVKLGNKFQLETGIAYIQRGDAIAVSASDLIFFDQLDEISSLLMTPSDEVLTFDELKTKSYFQQLELPIRLNLFFNTVDKGVFLTAGIRPSLILNSKFKVIKIKDGKKTSDGVQDDSFNPAKDFNLFGRLSLGYALPINKINLNFSTYFDHQLLNGGLNGFDYYTYSFGALVGVGF